jgi:hypothetical protein
MNRLLYEKSVSYKGYLIIPFILGRIGCETIYSYKLLSEQGHRNDLHQSDNLSGVCGSSPEAILKIARKSLDEKIKNYMGLDQFRDRYIYQNNMIVLHHQSGKYFYDHYPPAELKNIAAPKLFVCESDCLSWIKQGLDRQKVELSEIWG